MNASWMKASWTNAYWMIAYKMNKFMMNASTVQVYTTTAVNAGPDSNKSCCRSEFFTHATPSGCRVAAGLSAVAGSLPKDCPSVAG